MAYRSSRPIAERVHDWVLNLDERCDRIVVREGGPDEDIQGSVRCVPNEREVIAAKLANLVVSVANMAKREVTLCILALHKDDVCARTTMAVEPQLDEKEDAAGNPSELMHGVPAADALREANLHVRKLVGLVVGLVQQVQADRATTFRLQNEMFRIYADRLSHVEAEREKADRLARTAVVTVTEATQTAESLAQKLEEAERRGEVGGMLAAGVSEEVREVVAKVGAKVIKGISRGNPNGASDG